MANKQPESSPTTKRGRGRPEGSANKTTAAAREAFNTILQGRAKKVGAWIDKIAKDDPAKACDLLLRIAEFYIPKPQRVELANAPNPDGSDGEMVFRVKRG